MNKATNELKWHLLFRESLNFCSCTTWFLDLHDLVRINGKWLYKDLKVSDLQANATLAQLVRHWTLKPVIISCIRWRPTGGNFFLLLLNPLMAILPFLPTLYKLWKTWFRCELAIPIWWLMELCYWFKAIYLLKILGIFVNWDAKDSTWNKIQPKWDQLENSEIQKLKNLGPGGKKESLCWSNFAYSGVG